MKVTRKMTVPLGTDLQQVADKIQHQMESRAVRASYELYNSAQLVLRGQRSGRRYKVPGTYGTTSSWKRNKSGKLSRVYRKKNGVYYTASAPGEPPAVRTGVFRMSWQPTSKRVFGAYFSRIESDARTDNGRYNLGEILENGTSRMSPRPFTEPIIKKSEDRINRIYSEPYIS